MNNFEDLLNNKNFTLALVALVLYLAFLYCQETKKHEGLNSVPLNLLDQSMTDTAWGNGCGNYRRYTDRESMMSDEANIKLQKEKGYKNRSYLDRIDRQYQNYMESDKQKLTRPYNDEYNMAPNNYYPQPINQREDLNNCPCADK